MGDKASLLNLEDKPPVVRLILSLLFTVVTGTMIFWLFILCGTLIFGVSASEMLKIPEQGAGAGRTAILRYVLISQQIGLFLVPSVILAIFFQRRNDSFLIMDHSPGLINVILIVSIFIFIMPVVTWTGAVNSKMVLPEQLSWIEDIMREKEERANVIAGSLLGSDGTRTTIINLLTLALLPAFAEELLFRGIFQQLIIKVFRSAHFGIWFTAILFSAVHFQFYTFLPRMILGLLFGYLFLWTGSLWSAIIPHFINNAIPVFITFFSAKRGETDQISGVINGFPFIQTVFSAMLLSGIWYLNRKKTE